MGRHNINFDEGQFEKIFGEKDEEQKGKQDWIFDEDKGKLVSPQEYYKDKEFPNKGPDLFFRGNGWGYQHKKFRGVEMSSKQYKRMVKNPYFTTFKDKRKRIHKKAEEAKEQKAQALKKIKGNSL